MLKNKVIFAVGATFLFIALAMVPASATDSSHTLRTREFETVNSVMNKLLDDIEQANSLVEVINLIKSILSNGEIGAFPIIRNILQKIIEWTFSQRSLLFNNEGILNMFNNGGLADRANKKLVISFGSYQKRLLEKKDEKVTFFKQGFATWRYSAKAKLSQGRTLVLERQPFAVQQRVKGKQFGVMLGFSGLFIDLESKLTGNSYVIIMGNARRARAFDLTPFSD